MGMIKKILVLCVSAAAAALMILPAGAWLGRPFGCSLGGLGLGGCGFGGLPFGISSGFSSFSSYTSFTSVTHSFSSFGGCGW